MMFQSIRKHLSYANVAATLALVFALTGGAFAATGGSGGGGSPAKATASVKGGSGRQNQTVAVVAKKKKKTTSTRGPAGPAGKSGTNGTNGAPGANGPAGPAGPTGPAGAGTQGEKGVQGEKGLQGEKGTPGTNGTTGFTETLPPEKTETGSWALGEVGALPANTTEIPARVPISFPIPLPPNPNALEPDEDIEPSHVHYVKTGETVMGCNGTFQAPEAEPGYLCIYESTLISAKFHSVNNTGVGGEGAGPTGAQLVLFTQEGGQGWGTWAVTAPSL